MCRIVCALVPGGPAGAAEAAPPARTRLTASISRSAPSVRIIGSRVRPLAQEIVVAARQRDDGGVLGDGLVDLVDRHVEIEQRCSPLLGVLNCPGQVNLQIAGATRRRSAAPSPQSS